MYAYKLTKLTQHVYIYCLKFCLKVCQIFQMFLKDFSIFLYTH